MSNLFLEGISILRIRRTKIEYKIHPTGCGSCAATLNFDQHVRWYKQRCHEHKSSN